ncbi:Hypothetical predicted protein, partial [Xyrichtys novacula]
EDWPGYDGSADTKESAAGLIEATAKDSLYGVLQIFIRITCCQHLIKKTIAEFDKSRLCQIN